MAGWLLIPREGETDAIVQGWLGTGQARRWVSVIFVGLAVIILVSETGLISGDLAFAVVLIGIGVMLYRGDLNRGDRRPRHASRPIGRYRLKERPRRRPLFRFRRQWRLLHRRRHDRTSAGYVQESP